MSQTQTTAHQTTPSGAPTLSRYAKRQMVKAARRAGKVSPLRKRAIARRCEAAAIKTAREWAGDVPAGKVQ